jgi:hypothetical protein
VLDPSIGDHYRSGYERSRLFPALQQEWADSRRHEQILFAARAVETEPSVIGFSHHFIATATRR